MQSALAWANDFDYFSYFNPNNIAYPFDPFLHFLAADCLEVLSFGRDDPFETIKRYHQQHQDWLIGFLGYDLKNTIEDLSSKNIDRIQNQEIHFFSPKHLIYFEKDQIMIQTVEDPAAVYAAIQQFHIPSPGRTFAADINQAISKENYIDRVKKIQQHILEGDIYEMNFCFEFFAENCQIDPVAVYYALCQLSPKPFSVLQKVKEHFLLSASPERFLKKTGEIIISQPIKGTAPRGKNSIEDVQLKSTLRDNEKEQAENLMIVDLVRNDLAKSAQAGSVKVTELFGIYSFSQVHQMISTVTATLKPDLHFTAAIRNAFPMGSMTGAPKIKVMELIELYEQSKRGLYAGAAGYITPKGDFDFNVVIRSILYNQGTKMLSFHVGSAITYDSDPEAEYKECLLKAHAILQVLRSP